jgi:hypothetical protein
MAFTTVRPDASECTFICYYHEIEGYNDGYADEQPAHASFLRDIFGNPFRPVNLNPFLLTPTVKALAQSIYTERSFEEMPILADCLEESGCNNKEILSHLRGAGRHTRGCWALDHLLGKS